MQSDFLKNLLRQNNLETPSVREHVSEVDYLDTRENEDYLDKIKNNNLLLNFDFKA